MIPAAVKWQRIFIPAEYGGNGGMVWANVCFLTFAKWIDRWRHGSLLAASFTVSFATTEMSTAGKWGFELVAVTLHPHQTWIYRRRLTWKIISTQIFDAKYIVAEKYASTSTSHKFYVWWIFISVEQFLYFIFDFIKAFFKAI